MIWPSACCAPCWRPAAAARARWWTRRSATAPRCWPPPITASCATATGSTAGKPTCWMAARALRLLCLRRRQICVDRRDRATVLPPAAGTLRHRRPISSGSGTAPSGRAAGQAGGAHRRQDPRRMVRAARRQRRLLRRCSISRKPRTIRNTARAPASSRPTASATQRLRPGCRARLGRRGRFTARPAHRGTAGRPGLVAVRHPGPARNGAIA